MLCQTIWKEKVRPSGDTLVLYVIYVKSGELHIGLCEAFIFYRNCFHFQILNVLFCEQQFNIGIIM